MEREDARQPPVVLPPLDSDDVAGARGKHTFRDAGDWLDRFFEKESYGAPRVFDIFTLFAITLAFALLLAFLRLIEPLLMEDLSSVAIIIGIFVTGIGLSQMVLWGGKQPRLSSLVAGPFLWLSILIVTVAINQNGARNLQDPNFIVFSVLTSVIGIAAGYLGGTMVAGVFLLADFFRTKYLYKPKQTVANNDDDVFKD